jgi:hypothetical protein
MYDHGSGWADLTYDHRTPMVHQVPPSRRSWASERGLIQMEIDAFLADSVVAADGKLYVQGAGWNIIYAHSFPIRHSRIGVGIIIQVPYTATNQTHKLEVHIEDSDGQVLPLGDAPSEIESEDGKIQRLEGEFNVGRPPLLPAGDEQVVPLAINIDGMVFDKPDRLNVVVSIDGTKMKRLGVRVQQLVQSPQPIAR